MKLYDIVCNGCERVEKDVIATSAKKAGKTCDTCGGDMTWKPSFGYADSRQPWYCVQTDQTFSSYRELEKWCEKNGKQVVTQKDYDTRVRGRGTDYEQVVAKYDTRRREAVRKAMADLRNPDTRALPEDVRRMEYRRRHGYKD